jgi:hypothetical protein
MIKTSNNKKTKTIKDIVIEVFLFGYKYLQNTPFMCFFDLFLNKIKELNLGDNRFIFLKNG